MSDRYINVVPILDNSVKKGGQTCVMPEINLLQNGMDALQMGPNGNKPFGF